MIDRDIKSDPDAPITFSGNNIDPNFFNCATPVRRPNANSVDSAGSASSSSTSRSFTFERPKRRISMASASDTSTVFKGYPSCPVDPEKFPRGKAPKDGWKVAYMASYEGKDGKVRETEAMTCRTSGPSDLPGYIEIFAGRGDKVNPGWANTIHFTPGTDVEYSFCTTISKEPVRSLKAVKNALFGKNRKRLLGFWEYFEFRTVKEGQSKKSRKRKASTSSTSDVASRSAGEGTSTAISNRRHSKRIVSSARPAMASNSNEDNDNSSEDNDQDFEVFAE